MMQSISDIFINEKSVDISFLGFIINISITAFLSFLLGKVYVRFGNSFSNKKDLARNFILLSLVTMLVITIVKSSLALSLGLVGALSIVRFRTAIKEPEELLYLFFCISIGLGLGADQRLITIVAFVLITAIIFLISRNISKEMSNENLILKIKSTGVSKISIDEVVEVLSEISEKVDLRRVEDSSDLFEASFLIEIDNVKRIKEIKDSFTLKDKEIAIVFLDNKGVVSI